MNRDNTDECCYYVHDDEDECPAFDAKRGRECCYDSHGLKDKCDNAD